MKVRNTLPLSGMATLLLCISLLQGCKEQVVVEKKLRPVKSMVVTAGETSRSRVFSGTAHAAQEADLSFKVGGTIEGVQVKVGDQVSRGHLIANLNKDTYLVELEQARADAAQANALRRSAESEYQRVRQLYANDNASRNELDSALADAESAKASLDAAIQNEKLAGLNLSYTELKVESDCAVAAVNIEPNENVSSGQTVAEVSCGDAWEVQIDVPESLIANFSDGLSGTAIFPSVPDEEFIGQVTEVGVGTSSNSTFPVTLSLTQTPSNIRSNLAAEVTFRFASFASTAFFLPSTAVSKDEVSNFVYVLEATDEPTVAVLRKRAVTVGELTELGIEVLEGLNDGERIIVAGLNNVLDGMRVRDE